MQVNLDTFEAALQAAVQEVLTGEFAELQTRLNELIAGECAKLREPTPAIRTFTFHRRTRKTQICEWLRDNPRSTALTIARGLFGPHATQPNVQGYLLALEREGRVKRRGGRVILDAPGRAPDTWSLATSPAEIAPTVPHPGRRDDG